MSPPILSNIIAVAELFIYGAIFYAVATHLRGKKFRPQLLRQAIHIQLLAIVYMLTRLKPAQDLAGNKSNLELLVIGHAALSILVFFWLAILFFKAKALVKVGRNYFQENAPAVYLFLVLFSLSFLSGELIFFLVY